MSEKMYDWYTKVISKEAQFITLLGKARYVEFEKNYWKWVDQLQKDAKILEFWAWNWSFVQYLLNKWFTNITIVEYSQSVFEEQKYFFGDKVKIVKNDVLSFLKNTNDKYDYIVWIQVIEHLDADYFFDLLQIIDLKLNIDGFAVFETPNMANITYGTYFRYGDFTHKIWYSPISCDGLIKSTMNNITIFSLWKKYISLFDILKFRNIHIKDFLWSKYLSDWAEKIEQSIWWKILSAIHFLIMQPFKVWMSKKRSKFYLKNFEWFQMYDIYDPNFIFIIQKIWK